LIDHVTGPMSQPTETCTDLLANTGIGQRIDVLTNQSALANQSIDSPINQSLFLTSESGNFEAFSLRI